MGFITKEVEIYAHTAQSSTSRTISHSSVGSTCSIIPQKETMRVASLK